MFVDSAPIVQKRNILCILLMFSLAIQVVHSQNAEGDGQPTSLGYWLIALMIGTPLLMIMFNILIVQYYNDKDDNWKVFFAWALTDLPTGAYGGQLVLTVTT